MAENSPDYSVQYTARQALYLVLSAGRADELETEGAPGHSELSPATS
ncbi:MAG: hypothetical protein WDO69_02540 [Pseudomonadota bacterium]